MNNNNDNKLKELKNVFAYLKGTNLSKAIVFSALDINKLNTKLPIQDYRENRFSVLWRETFSTSENWTAQYRTELNQGEGRLAHRLFEGEEGYYKLKELSKLKDADAAILKSIVNEYKQIFNRPIEEMQDANLVLETSNIEDNGKEFHHKGEKKEKEEPQTSGKNEFYPRDRETAINALIYAHYRCEINPKHETFIRKDGKTPYTEPHHLVPLSSYKDFDISLDVEENIVSLCSHCHNMIHYGKDGKELVKKLFNQRKEELKKVGIEISIEKLLEYY